MEEQASQAVEGVQRDTYYFRAQSRSVLSIEAFNPRQHPVMTSDYGSLDEYTAVRLVEEGTQLLHYILHC